MLIPAPRLLGLAGLLCFPALAAVFMPALAPAVWTAAALLLALAVADSVRGARLPSPHIVRSVPASLALGVAREVRLTLINQHPRSLSLRLYEHVPESVAIEGLPRTLSIPAQGTASFGYPIRPVARGDHQFGPAEIRLGSPFKLWELRRRCGEATAIRIYPNFAEVRKYALFAIDHRLAQLGVLQRRRRGEGLDFQELRDYRRGDALRQIDWKATTRFGKPISREYQDERNQQIVFLLDCGRRMGAQDGALSHFDHTLNAALLLAWVGLRQGDAVGLMTMGTPGAIRYLKPRRSRGTLRLVLNSVFDLQPALVTTDYMSAATALLARLRKRALVVMLTNVRDEDCDDLLPAVRLLQKHHLVLVASLREQAVLDMLLAPVRQLGDATAHAAAADYLLSRREAFDRARYAGAICLDVEPQALPVQLVNRYLDIKRSGRL